MAYNAVKTGSISGKNEFFFTVKELSGGLCERQFELSDSQTRELKNMVFDDGFLKTRPGFSLVSELSGTYHSDCGGDFFGNVIIHAGKYIYRYDGNECIEIFSEAANCDSLFYSMNACLYLLTRERNIYEISKDFTVKEVQPYIPNIVNTKDGNCFDYDVDEDINMMSKRVSVSYYIEEEAGQNVFRTPFPLNSDKYIKAYIHLPDGTKLESTAKANTSDSIYITKWYIKGMSHFSLEYELLGEDEKFAEYFEKIYESRLAFCYGGNESEGTRAFLTGCSKHPGWYCMSELKKPLYFPDTKAELLGDGTENITAVGKRYEKVYLFTERHIYSMSYQLSVENGPDFTVAPVNTAVGCSMPGTVALIDNTLVFGNKYSGVHIMQSTDVFGELNIMHISQNISPGVGFAKDGVFCSCDFDRKYYICNGEYIYYWDYGRTPYYTSGDYKKAGQRLSWYRISGAEDCRSLICPGGKLSYISGGEKACLFTENRETELDSFSGEKNRHVDGSFLTKDFDFDVLHLKKRLDSFSFEYKSETKTVPGVRISFYGNGEKYCSFVMNLTRGRGRKKLKLPMYPADRFSVKFEVFWGAVGFGNFIFHAQTVDRTKHGG